MAAAAKPTPVSSGDPKVDSFLVEQFDQYASQYGETAARAYFGDAAPSATVGIYLQDKYDDAVSNSRPNSRSGTAEEVPSFLTSSTPSAAAAPAPVSKPAGPVDSSVPLFLQGYFTETKSSHKGIEICFIDFTHASKGT